MMYADFSFYKSEYLGDVLTEQDFPKAATRASTYLDCITLGKAARNPDLFELKMACCALSEQYQAIDAARALMRTGMSESDAVQSETVGEYSRTMRSGGDRATAAIGAEKSINAQLYSIASMYLATTGLLYRGGCACTLRTS